MTPHDSSLHIASVDAVPAWNAYVDAHPKGSIFHRSEMVNVYGDTPRHEPFAIAALNSGGQIVALLVAIRVETVAGLASRFASRSILHAEPLCDDSDEGVFALRQLIREHDSVMNTRTLFSEVRSLQAPGAERTALEESGHAHADYLNYVVNLKPDSDALWHNLSKSCRQKIRRSQRRGVEIYVDNSHDSVACMYELIASSYQRSKVPLADISLFDSALDRLPADSVGIRIARYQGDAVAGGIVLLYKGTMFAWYGGSTRTTGIAPFDCLTWDEIQWGSENGHSRYDFGGAGWPNEHYGPRDFKAKFGGQLVCYGRYRRIWSPWKLRVVETAYKTARRFLSFSEPGAK